MLTVTSPATLSFSGSDPRNVQCLGCGVPLRLRANFIVVTLLSLSPCPTCLRPARALAPLASLRGIFRANVQPNHRSSAGCHRRRFTFPTPMAIPLNTLHCLMKRPSASLSVRFQPGRRDKRWFNHADAGITPRECGPLRRRIRQSGSGRARELALQCELKVK
jgi:hypothetical protein